MPQYKRVFTAIKLVVIAVLSAALVLLTAGVVSAPAANAQNYGLKHYADHEQSILFIVSPDITDEESVERSRRKASVFRQVLGSYWWLNSNTVEAQNYTPGLIDNYDAVIVVDEHFQELPQQLADDLAGSTGKKITYFGLGGARLLNSVAGVKTHVFQESVVFDTATYKDTLLESGGATPQLDYTFDPRSPLAPGVRLDVPLTAGDAQNNQYPAAAHVVAGRGAAGTSDLLIFPFKVPNYYDPQSYTNAVLDLLHIPLGEVPAFPKEALVRLEDVNTHTYAQKSNSFRDAAAALKERGIPFHIAYIERYVDPSKDIDTTIVEHRHFKHYLEEVIAKDNAVLVQHGYTHQSGDGVSGPDFEFAEENNGQPVSEDQAHYAYREEQVRDIVADAKAGMEADGLPVPDIWETPHYRLGATADAVLKEHYPIRYEPARGIGSFPFPVMIDGIIYVPENLGYIYQDWSDEFPAFKKRLKQLQVFRNAVPSFFWHPWRETHEVEELVDLLRGEGYTFVTAYDLLQDPSMSSGYLAHQELRNNYDGNISYHVINAGILVLYLVLIWGVLRYFYESHRFRKFFRISRRWNRSLDEVTKLHEEKGKALPNIAIFVPARNEGLVIANTIANLASLDYPKDRYQIVVITDERELADDVDVLTKDVVIKEAARLNKEFGTDLVTLIEVPEYYSGIYKDNSKTFAQSTKGRALNYALQTYRHKHEEKVDFIGVLDADGRLNQHVLKEVAYESLQNGAQVLQGPVYQVSNLSNVSIVGIMAGLELARFHLVSMMPRLMRRNKVQFLAGTNYFIDPELLDEADGWDQDALVEDAELALRLYVRCRVIARAITLPEVEQTPGSFRVYNKQRERWARGHFELLKPILRAEIPFSVKFAFVRKVLVSIYRLAFDLALPIVALVFLFLGYLREVDVWMQLASIITVISLVLMWDSYGQTYSRLAAYSDKPGNWRSKLWMRVRIFAFMPVFMVVQAIPRIKAFYRYLTRKKVTWAKTERTAEAPALAQLERSIA